jgi:tetratricopeptide (TPR) repeat protein
LEGSPTRSKPFIVLALLMLSLAATELAQAQGGENGTNQTVAPMAKADIPSKEERDLLGNIDKLVGILVGLTVLYAFFRKRGKKAPSDGGVQHVETAKDSAISFGDHSPAIKADRIEGGVHITYPGTKEPTVAEKPLGKINNIPHPHNPNFTGRVDLLEKLHQILAAGERAAFTQTSAITGLGGVGKTQLALEYSYSHADDYRVVWWVRSEEPATLAADYAGLASRLDLPEKGSQDQRVIVEAVRRWLEENGGWLLVFDNAHEPEDLNGYLPLTGKGDVIITSRNPNWGGTAKALPVDVFSRDESIDFLQSRTGQKDGADALAGALGDLPLALEQAGAYIQETGVSLSAYLKLFQERQKELLSRGKPDAYPDTVATTWDLSFQKASEEVPASADLLNLCSFLAPDNIPKSLLSEGVEQLPDPLASTVTDDMALNDAIAALKRYPLLTVADDYLSVHRLVQAVARDRLSEKEQKRWAEAAVRLVNGAFPQKSQDVRTWDECSALLPHALAAAGHSEELEVAHESTGRLLNQTGLYLRGRAEFSEAKSVHERALEIGEKVYGPDHPNVAKTIKNLGGVLREMGDFDGARKCYERALKICDKALGSDHPNVAIIINSLSLVLQDMGDLEDAKEHLEQALKIDEEVYGPYHPAVARDTNNLGIVWWSMSDLKGAKEHLERALKIDENVMGVDHSKVSTAVNNLAWVSREMGGFDGAKKYYERALEIREKEYGPDHPNVATIVSNLGTVLEDMGDLAGAKEHYERALVIYVNHLGEDHPYTKNVHKLMESLRR